MATNNQPAFSPTIVKRQVRFRGPLEAIPINDTLDEIHADIVAMADYLSRLQIDLERRDRTRTNELFAVRERVGELEARIAALHQWAADSGNRLTFSTDFRNLEPIGTTRFSEDKRLRVDPMYGQVTVPFNQYRSRFHIADPRTGNLFVPETLVATVSEIDERGGTVTEGTVRNAFNGQNEDFWCRQVAFPLASDVDAVTMQLDVEIPLQFAQNNNCLTLNPYPQDNLDITEILYSTDASDPSTLLPGFPSGGINNAGPTRFYFAPTAMTKLRIKFRQRHWTERDEQKVFFYGLQELDLPLIEFDKTDDPSILNNNLMVVTVDAPSGFQFNEITNFLTDPFYETAGNPDIGIFVQAYVDETLSTKVWDSLTDPAPKDTPVDVSIHATDKLYLLVSLTYEPNNQNTPVLEHLALEYTVTT